jgi:dihydrofolate reductase
VGKVVVSEFILLDGVIEDPGAEGTEFGGWTFRFPADDGQQFKFEEVMASDVQLMGRVTYEEFAAAWPAMAETTGEFGAKMNTMPKVVVSTSLADPAWTNTTVATGDDLPSTVAELKEQYDGDILVPGSATFVGSLNEHDLIDEHRLMVHPVVLGQGKRLFQDGSTAVDLSLVEARNVGPDVQLVIYRTA